jgi:hypothetical protein
MVFTARWQSAYEHCTTCKIVVSLTYHAISIDPAVEKVRQVSVVKLSLRSSHAN